MKHTCTGHAAWNPHNCGPRGGTFSDERGTPVCLGARDNPKAVRVGIWALRASKSARVRVAQRRFVHLSPIFTSTKEYLTGNLQSTLAYKRDVVRSSKSTEDTRPRNARGLWRPERCNLLKGAT